MPPAPASNSAALTVSASLRGVRTNNFTNMDACSLTDETASSAVEAVQAAPIVSEPPDQLHVCLELGRLDQIAAGAGLIRGRDVALGLRCAQHDHGDVAHALAGLDAAQHLEAVHPRQTQIQQHQIGTR